MKEENKDIKQIKDTDALHYVVVVPSEWEEEIREVLVRPIFVRANLVSKEDNRDRLLFCTDIESIYYYIIQYQYSNDLKLSRNTIIGRIIVVEENKVLIRLNLILIGNPLFDFSNSLLFPKLVASNSSFLTTNDVKNEETIQNIIEEIPTGSFFEIINEDKISYSEEPFITDKSISELDKNKHLPSNLKLLLQNDLVKEYSLLRLNSTHRKGNVDKGLLD
ncbi:hypothetical protein EDC94DRAFT_592883, partial [Helicostylum pulchrum]